MGNHTGHLSKKYSIWFYVRLFWDLVSGSKALLWIKCYWKVGVILQLACYYIFLEVGKTRVMLTVKPNETAVTDINQD